jgi:hypothetical protein
MAITRRTAPAAPVAPPPPQYAQPQVAPTHDSVNFMDMGFYMGGFLVPQGNYVITDVVTRLFKGEKQPAGSEKLGVQITFIPLNDPRQESKKEQFYSMGGSTHLSFMPSPDGSGIVAIPNAPSQNAPNSTNWAILLKSLYDCGLPIGICTNSVKPLEGTWVYVTHIDEPEERSQFQSNTSEVQTRSNIRKKIAVIGEILDGGKPWEGSGGWPDKPVAVNGHAAPLAHVAPPAPAAGVDLSDVRTSALNAISDVLEAEAKAGKLQTARIALRNGVFNNLMPKLGEAGAGAVLAQVFDAPGVLNTVLGDLGMKVAGAMIVNA